MMIAKGLALVSVLWNLAGNSEAPFLAHQPGAVPAPVASSAPATPVTPARPVVAAASPAPEPSTAPSPEAAPSKPTGPQAGPLLTGFHVTGWVMMLPQRLGHLIEASKQAGLTAMIFEVKDVNGELFYKMETSDGTNHFAEAIKACHAAGLKVVARYCAFKDKALEEKNAATRYGTTPGTDTRHKPWTNPVAPATVEHNLAQIKEIVAMGVDEVNLDYIRFPSGPEGVHIDLPLPEKCKTIANFVRQVRAVVPKPIRLSMDVFGYVAWDADSARVGQRLEDLAPYVDGIYPMLYPDHFAKGDLGYKFPVEHPYEVIRRGCEAARAKKGMEHITVVPWIQAFFLPSDTLKYGATEMLAQMQGARDAGINSWWAWSPRVHYEEVEHALAMVKGRSDYSALVKRYIPEKYRAATGEPVKVAAQTVAVETESGEDEAPAAPAKARKTVASAAPSPKPVASAAAAPAAKPGEKPSFAVFFVAHRAVEASHKVLAWFGAKSGPAAAPEAGTKPEEAPASPFASTPVLGAARVHKKPAKSPGTRTAAKPAKKKKKSAELEDTSEESSDSELYNYKPRK